MPDLLATIEDLGHRLTRPRRRIVELLGSKEEGFTAEAICQEVPGVGRATVYRTIKLLLEAGVICKLPLMDGAPRYSLARAEHHHHAVCVRCGNVSDFRHSTVERLLKSVGKDISGEIVGHRIEFYVICEACLPGDGEHEPVGV